MMDNTWNECANKGCHGPRDGGARFCAPCFRESIRQQEQYERDAHNAMITMFAPKAALVAETPARPSTCPVKPKAKAPRTGLGAYAGQGPVHVEPEPQAEPGVLASIANTLAELVERLNTGAFKEAPEAEDEPVQDPPALDEPPPTDYRTPADGYGEAKPYVPPAPEAAHYLDQGRYPGDTPAVASRELHGSHILELGPGVRGVITVAPPGRFACADVHGFRLWIPGAPTLAAYEALGLVNVITWGCVVYGECGGGGPSPASHYIRLRDLPAYGGGVIRIEHHRDIQFTLENMGTAPARIGVILDVTGYDKHPPPPPRTLGAPCPHIGGGS